MSSADFPAYVPDKDDLKDALSVYYVAAKLGINIDTTGEAICPFHEDTTPSFYVFDGDDGVQRWWCQPCGHGGDIISLVMEKEGVGYSESLIMLARMLADLPPGYQAPTRQARPRPRPEDWADEVTAAQQRAAAPSFAGVLAIRAQLLPASEEAEARRWDAYLRGTWRLGIDEHGTVLVPHYEANGTLEGCKLRMQGGRKESIPGSKFEHLYGADLGRRNRDALITEGESDAWWAGFQAAEEHIPLDVFAMPSGAQQPISELWLDTLEGVRTLYLALDPDGAGVEATRRWIDALNGRGFQDVRVCCLPKGRDLREAQPRLSQLLELARKPLQGPGDMKADPGGYVRLNTKTGDWHPVTSWWVEPTAQLAGGDDPGFDAILHSRGVKTETVIRLTDLATVQNFNRWAGRHEEIYTGTDTDRQRIAELIKATGAITPEIFQTDRVGLHDPPARYHFAGRTVVLPDGYIGNLPWRYAPTSKAKNVRGEIMLPASGLFHWRALKAFLAMSGTEVTHPLLAWAVAAARRPEIREFPLLFIGGSSGVGKSTLARQTIKLLGSAIEIDLGANTPFILYRTLSCSTSLPVFVDEWTRLSRDDTRQAFQGIVPLLYTGGIAERGMADLNTMGYRVSAPTLIAGEDTFALDRELERTVCVVPSRAKQNHAALAYIQSVETQRFGDGLHHWIATHREALPPMPGPAPNRIEYNRQVLLAGWLTMRAYLDFCASNSEDVPDVPVEPDLSCFEPATSEDAQENVYVTALTEGAALNDQNGIPVVWIDSQGRGTWVRFSSLVGLIETRRLDIQLPGRSRAMAAYFAERYGAIHSKITTPPLGVRPVRAHLIPGLLVGQEITEQEEAVGV